MSKKVKRIFMNYARQGYDIIRNEHGFGFVTMIIVAIFLVAIITAVLSYTSKSTSVDTSTYSAQSYASGIISQGTNLKSGFDLMMNTKLKTINEITFDNAAGTGLFHPTDGGTVPQPVQMAAIDTNANLPAAWLYRTASIKDVGTTAERDYIVILPGLKEAVCEQINKTLLGSSGTSSSFTSTGITANDWRGNADATNPSDVAEGRNINLSGIAAFDGRTEGCARTSDNRYVYYQVVKAR